MAVRDVENDAPNVLRICIACRTSRCFQINGVIRTRYRRHAAGHATNCTAMESHANGDTGCFSPMNEMKVSRSRRRRGRFHTAEDCRTDSRDRHAISRRRSDASFTRTAAARTISHGVKMPAEMIRTATRFILLPSPAFRLLSAYRRFLPLFPSGHKISQADLFLTK